MRVLPSLFRYHHQLMAAIAIGVLAGVFLPTIWPRFERLLIGWNTGLWTYLALLWWMMATAPPARVRQLAEREDESAPAVLLSVVIATLASLAAIVLELATAKGASGGAQQGVHITLSAITLIGGWLLLPTLFTIHYTRLYFADNASAPPLRFPDQPAEPDYWDFAYFAFTIAVASQTSDVALATRQMRRVALAQSVLSFFFNLAVLGLSVNIAAGLI